MHIWAIFTHKCNFLSFIVKRKDEVSYPEWEREREGTHNWDTKRKVYKRKYCSIDNTRADACRTLPQLTFNFLKLTTNNKKSNNNSNNNDNENNISAGSKSKQQITKKIKSTIKISGLYFLRPVAVNGHSLLSMLLLSVLLFFFFFFYVGVQSCVVFLQSCAAHLFFILCSSCFLYYLTITPSYLFMFTLNAKFYDLQVNIVYDYTENM